jgi:hypothetical protein
LQLFLVFWLVAWPAFCLSQVARVSSERNDDRDIQRQHSVLNDNIEMRTPDGGTNGGTKKYQAIITCKIRLQSSNNAAHKPGNLKSNGQNRRDGSTPTLKGYDQVLQIRRNHICSDYYASKHCNEAQYSKEYSNQ